MINILAKLKRWIIKNKYWLIIFAITLAGAFLRFYNINWDDKYFFHPDERNVADAVYKVNFKGCFEYIFVTTLSPTAKECDLNPNFFAYGTLPIYITRLFANGNFDNTLNLLRAESALLSTLLIPVFYLIGQEFFLHKKRGEFWAILVSLLVAVNPGLIQFAHFGTFEIYLTFEYSLFFLLLMKYANNGKIKMFYWASAILGACVATKIVSLAVIPVLFIAYLIVNLKNLSGKSYSIFKKIKLLRYSQIFRSLMIILAVAFLCSPYMLLDYKSFIGSMNYEGPVANGTLPVFYTQQFIETVPVLYQFSRVFPYILGIALTVFFVYSFVFLLINIFWQFIKHIKGKAADPMLLSKLLLILMLLAYGVFHLTMYVKWTRYMIPLLPFMILTIVVYFKDSFNFIKTERLSRIIFIVLSVILLSFSALEGLVFFTRYLGTDSRIQTADWFVQNIGKDKTIAWETADIGVQPIESLWPPGSHVTFDIYNLDNNDKSIIDSFNRSLTSADYIILMSNRLYPSRLRLHDKYPKGYDFYNGLNNGSLGFKQVAAFSRTGGLITTKIDLTDSLSPLYPDETYNVFDNPTVIVYERVDL